MRPVSESSMTRHRFRASTTLTAGVVCFAPRESVRRSRKLGREYPGLATTRNGVRDSFVPACLRELVYQGV